MSLSLLFAGVGRASGGPAVPLPVVPETPLFVPAAARVTTVPLDEGNYVILGPASARIVIRSPKLVLGRRSRDDEAAALLGMEL